MKAPLSKCVHTYTPTLRDQSNGRKCSISSSSGSSVCRHSGHSHSMSTGQTSVACAVLELSWSYKLQQAAIINKESWRLASWLRPSLCVTSNSFPAALSKRKKPPETLHPNDTKRKEQLPALSSSAHMHGASLTQFQFTYLIHFFWRRSLVTRHHFFSLRGLNFRGPAQLINGSHAGLRCPPWILTQRSCPRDGLLVIRVG